MNTKIKSIFKTIALSLGALLIVSTAVYATGTLTPGDTPGEATQYTLNDIYTKLTTNNSTSTKSGLFATPESVAANFSTLTEIYDAIPTIDATKVATGTSYLGVEGTLATSTPDLEWSTAQGGVTWFTAESICAGTVDGSTGWRLPTISELLAAISDDWIIDGGASPRFASYTLYWSGSEYDGSYAWNAGWVGYVYSHLDDKTYSTSVRCVR